jgi:dihydrofolate reductase
MLKLIVAHCKNKGIGKNNMLPWHLSSDLKHFKALTVGKTNNSIIMGKNTWKSLNSNPLPNRKNIVVSTTLNNDNENCIVKRSLQDAIAFSNKNNFDETWIIGGEKLYKSTINTVDINEIHITEILEDFDCDTFFPELPSNYSAESVTHWRNENNISYRQIIYKNKVKPGEFMYNILPNYADNNMWK